MDRLVFLHGFTQTHHHWHRTAHLVANRLPGDPTLAFLDLPGHGLAADDTSGTFDDAGRRIVDLAGAGTYIGYSMGGRLALAAAATGSSSVERLVLIGATPGVTDDAERADRARLDDERARRVEEIGVDAFLADWLAMPMFARLPDDPAGLARRRANTVGGLAHSLRAYGTGVQTPLWDRLSHIDLPVLVLAGELDAKFVEIGVRMAGLLPRATFAAIANAGHAAHVEHPEATAELIAEWLAAEQ